MTGKEMHTPFWTVTRWKKNLAPFLKTCIKKRPFQRNSQTCIPFLLLLYWECLMTKTRCWGFPPHISLLEKPVWFSQTKWLQWSQSLFYDRIKVQMSPNPRAKGSPAWKRGMPLTCKCCRCESECRLDRRTLTLEWWECLSSAEGSGKRWGWPWRLKPLEVLMFVWWKLLLAEGCFLRVGRVGVFITRVFTRTWGTP